MKITKSKKHNKGLLILALAALLGVTAGVAVWLWYDPPATTPTSPAGRNNDMMTNLPSYTP